MSKSIFINGLLKQEQQTTIDQLTLWENSKIWKRVSYLIKYLLACFNPFLQLINNLILKKYLFKRNR